MHADMVWLILHKFNTMGIKENLKLSEDSTAYIKYKYFAR